jgi:glycosyltransferase involved in cell wall biosynthesis
VIPVYNRWSVTRQCLNTLLSRPPEVSCEIIVVDDGSRDITAQMLAAHSEHIRVVRHAANQGFAHACNDGAAIASGEFVVFLNNDTIPQRGWLDALVQYADAHPDAAVVGSKLLYPNNTIQHAGVVIAQNGYPNHLYVGLPGDHPAVNKSRRFQAVTAACMLVRRSAFEEVGGFDTAFTNCYEDVDLCLRLGERGHEIHCCHTSVLCHVEGQTRGGAVNAPDPYKDIAFSKRMYELRWVGRVRPDEAQYYLDDGLLAFTPDVPYPVQVTVSPLLAQVHSNTHPGTTEQLLAQRSRQVWSLMHETVRLEHQLAELSQNRGKAGLPGNASLENNWPKVRKDATLFEVRDAVGRLYLIGEGVEIGALHSPVKVEWPATVRYVDRLSAVDLREHYPELRDHVLVEPDIIDDGERLSSLADASQDFLIANHMLEHCQDPIGSIFSFFRVLKPGGILYMAIPDKRFTFDHRRPATPLSHLIRDHEDGPEWSRAGHYQEWAALAEDVSTLGKAAEELMAMGYSIHFHVWTQSEILELFAALNTRYGLDANVELVLMNHIEVLCVLRKAL